MALQNLLLPAAREPQQTLPPAPVAGISINPTCHCTRLLSQKTRRFTGPLSRPDFQKL